MGVAFILAGVFSFPAHTAKGAEDYKIQAKIASGTMKITQADIDATIDALAPSYGLSASLVKKISQCEDQGDPYSTHANKHGDVVWSTDIGPLQINDYYHKAEMKKLGLNINKPIDNLKFGLSMMETEGTVPWKWSEPCWGK